MSPSRYEYQPFHYFWSHDQWKQPLLYPASGCQAHLSLHHHWGVFSEKQVYHIVIQQVSLPSVPPCVLDVNNLLFFSLSNILYQMLINYPTFLLKCAVIIIYCLTKLMSYWQLKISSILLLRKLFVFPNKFLNASNFRWETLRVLSHTHF